MADYSAYRIALQSQSYPITYDLLVTELQARATEIEDGRQGQSSLNANFSRYVNGVSGLIQDLQTNGFRITELPLPIAGSEPATKTYADALAFATVLPGINITTNGLEVTNNGSVAKWGHSAPGAAAVLAGWFNFF